MKNINKGNTIPNKLACWVCVYLSFSC